MSAVIFWQIIALALPATAAPIIYHVRFAWKNSLQGKSTMLLLAAIMVLVDLSVFYMVVPTAPAVEVVALVVYGLLFVALSVWCVMALRTQPDD